MFVIYMASRRSYKKKSSRKGSRKHHRRHMKKNMIMIGGDGGSTGYAQGVYGGIGQQQAQSPTNNEIVMNSQYAASMRGGDPLASQSTIGGLTPLSLNVELPAQKGGEVLTEIAVPAALLALNQGVVPRRHSNRNRRGSRRRRYRK